MRNSRLFLVGGIGVVLSFGNCEFPQCLDWMQWGQSSTHQGNVCSVGEPATQLLDDVVYDPFIAQESAESFGDIPIHYQTPLIADDDLYMEVKSGTYVSCNPPGSGFPAGCGNPNPDSPGTWPSEIWNEVHFKIADHGKLTRDWTFPSDWKPEPIFDFEPVFHAVVSGKRIYVPGAGGTVHKLDRKSGASLGRLNPFGTTIDPNTYVAGAISADDDGNIYYNALKLDANNPYADDVQGWLVKIDAKDRITIVDYATLVPDAPKPTDPCVIGYFGRKFKPPYPPINPDGTLPPPLTQLCGPQRPSINSAPAIAHDGTIYTVSHAHGANGYSYLIAVHPDLTPRWHASLRGLVDDGCGVLVPDDGDPKIHPGDCTPGSPRGIDPFTGQPPAMMATDSSSSSPVVLPDGSVLYGAYSNYNESRGHLLKFSRDGKFLTSFDFGWDVTPAVYEHDGTYSIITKDNHYENDLGPYYLTRLNADLKPEWQLQSTNTKSCTRGPDGTVSCVDDHPHGFEWCINAPAIDRDGTLYANSEDGSLYVVDKHGKVKTSFFLNQAIGAAYTPLSIDRLGHLFVLNGGHLSVVGQLPK
jgi:outer membrane protein assembly factor BamB